MSAEIQKYISEISNSFSLISTRIEFETLKDRISSKTLECENPDIWKYTLKAFLFRSKHRN